MLFKLHISNSTTSVHTGKGLFTNDVIILGGGGPKDLNPNNVVLQTIAKVRNFAVFVRHFLQNSAIFRLNIESVFVMQAADVMHTVIQYMCIAMHAPILPPPSPPRL